MSNVDLGTATGRITIDSSSAVSGINQFQTALNTLNTVVTRNWWGLTNVGLALGGISTAATAAFGVAARASVAWQDSMAKLNATLNGQFAATSQATSEINNLSAGLQQLAANTSVPISELAQIANTGASVGVAASSIVPFTQAVAELSTVGEASSSRLVTSFGRLVAVLGLSGDSIARLANVSFELYRQTPATAQSTLDLSQKLIGLTQSAGLTVPQILAIASAISTVASTPQRAAVSVTETINNMVKDATTGGQALNVFAATAGESVSSFAAKVRTDAAGAFSDFVVGLARLQGTGQPLIQVLNDIGIKGQFQIQIMTALATAQRQNAGSAETLASQLRIVTAAWNDSNGLVQAAEIQYRSAAGQFAEFKNQLVVLEQTLGAAFLPALVQVVQVLKGMVDTWNSLPGPVRDGVVVIGLAVTALTALGAIAFTIGPQLIQTYNALLAISRGMSEAANATKATAVAVEALATTERAEAVAAEAETLQKQAQTASYEALRLETAALAEGHRVAAAATNQSALADAQEAVALDNLRLRLAAVAQQEEIVAQAARDAAIAQEQAANIAGVSPTIITPGAGASDAVVAGKSGAGDAAAAEASAAALADEQGALLAETAAAEAGAAATEKLGEESARLVQLQNQATLAESQLKVMRDSHTTSVYRLTAATLESGAASQRAAEAAVTAADLQAQATRRLAEADELEAAAQQMRARATEESVASSGILSGIMNRITSGAGLMTLGMGAASGVIQGATGHFSTLGSTLTGVGSLMTLLAPETFGVAGVLGLATAAVGLGVTAFSSFSSAANTAKDSLNAVANADQQLTSILEQGGSAVAAQTNQWIVNQLVMSGAVAQADQLGISVAALIAIIQGTATDQTFNSIATQLTNASDKGDKGAKALGATLLQLSTVYSQSAQAAREYGASIASTGDTSSSSAQQTDALTQALQNQQKVMDSVAQAGLDLVGAEDSLAKAQDSLVSSQDNLTKAQAAQQNQAEDITKAQIDLARANITLSDSYARLATDQQTLKDAQATQATETADAASKVQDAQLGEQQAAQRLIDAQEALRKAQGPDAANALADATNRLRDSLLAVQQATMTVSDAQWQLQYLQNEGASKRDIENAQLTLNDAIQKQADAQQKVADDSQAIADQQLKNQDDLRKAIEGVATAQNDVVKANQAAIQAASDYSKALADAASNKDFNDALSKVKADQLDIQGNILAVLDAQHKVNDAVSEGPALAEAVKRAQDDVAASIFGVAKAQADVDKNNWLINNPGGTWTAQQNLDAVAGHLSALNSNFTGPAHDAVNAWIGDLARAHSAFMGVGKGSDTSAGGPTGPVGPGLDPGQLNQLQPFAGKPQDATAPWYTEIGHFFDQIGNDFKQDGILVGHIVGGWGTNMWTSLQNSGSQIGGFFSHLGSDIAHWTTGSGSWLSDTGRSVIGGMWDGMQTGWQTVSSFFSGLPGTVSRLVGDIGGTGEHIGSITLGGIKQGIDIGSGAVWGWLTGFTGWVGRGVGDVGGTGMHIGGMLAGNIRTGIDIGSGAVWGWATGFLGWVGRGIGNAGGWAMGIGGDIIGGIETGIYVTVHTIGNWASGFIGWVIRGMGDIWHDMYGVGKEVVNGMGQGILDFASQTVGHLPFIGGQIMSEIRQALGVSSPSTKMIEVGQQTMLGLAIGLQSTDPVMAALRSANTQIGGFQWSGLQQLQASLGVSGGGLSPEALASIAQTTALGQGQTGDTYHFYDTMPTAQEIVNEISWNRRVNARR